MARDPVQSSSIRSVGYSQQRHTLEIEFIGGSVYRYFMVPPDDHRLLLVAQSKGAYFNRHIRPRYRYERA